MENSSLRCTHSTQPHKYMASDELLSVKESLGRERGRMGKEDGRDFIGSEKEEEGKGGGIRGQEERE